MRNTILVIDVADAFKADTSVVRAEVGLGTDFDGLLAVVFKEYPQRFVHEGPADAFAAGKRGGDYPADAGVVRVGNAFGQNSGVGGQAAIFRQAQEVDGVLVFIVEVLVYAILFYNEYFGAEAEELVELVGGQVLVGDGFVG